MPESSSEPPPAGSAPPGSPPAGSPSADPLSAQPSEADQESQSSFTPVDRLPRLCGDLPGVGGVMEELDDFVVEELPAYPLSGAGEHVFVWIEKRGLTTAQAVERLATVGNVNARDVGTAGLKDKHGVTRQWLSLPSADTAALAAYVTDELRVLQVARHQNKLRTGHLAGNRFTITLRGVVGEAAQRGSAILERLASGMPNYYGPQRFGARGDNAEFARRILGGEARLPRDKRRRRFVVSALQSQLFNEAVKERLLGLGLFTMLDGDVLQKGDTGPFFVSEDQHVDQARIDAGELRITAPMCGPRATEPRVGSAARAWEAALMNRFGVTRESFAVFSRLARGGRRPVAITIGSPELKVAEGVLTIRFSLPAGSYATILLKELGASSVTLGGPSET